LSLENLFLLLYWLNLPSVFYFSQNRLFTPPLAGVLDPTLACSIFCGTCVGYSGLDLVYRMNQWIYVVGRAWVCQLDDLECCLGSHTLKWLVGVVFIATNKIVAVGEVCWQWAHRTVLCATRQCSVRHRTVSGVPPRHPPVRAWSWSTVGGFVLMWHRTVRCDTGQSGAPLTVCSDIWFAMFTL
jgi:hypothetical protein